MSLNEGLITLMHYFVGVWTVTQLFFTLVILGSRPTTPICNASVLPKASQEKSVGEEAREERSKKSMVEHYLETPHFFLTLSRSQKSFSSSIFIFFKVETSVAKKNRSF